MYILWIIVFYFVLLGGLFLTAFGFPGNWGMVVAAAVFAFFFPVGAAFDLGWWTVGGLAVLAGVGELLESFLGAAALAHGGSKRGAILAILGSMVGTFLGAALGVPIPVVGPIFGMILLGGMGAMAGAVIGELGVGKTQQESLRIGKIAFWGRLFGSVAKLLLGCLIFSWAVAASLIH